jgi:hypothetical protein
MQLAARGPPDHGAIVTGKKPKTTFNRRQNLNPPPEKDLT